MQNVIIPSSDSTIEKVPLEIQRLFRSFYTTFHIQNTSVLLFQFAVVCTGLVAVASSGRLEPQYLPPRSGGGGGYSGGSSGSGAFSGASSYSGGGGANIPILKYENVNNGDGNYRYRWKETFKYYTVLVWASNLCNLTTS